MAQAVDDARQLVGVEAWVRPIAFWTFSVLAVCLCAAVCIFPRLGKHQRLLVQARQLTAENDAMREENERLAREAQALAGDPFYIGQVARRDLGLEHPGETRLRVGTLYKAAPPRRPLAPERWAWLDRLQHLFTVDESLRRAAMVTAGALLLCAFIFFNRCPTAASPAKPTTQPRTGPASAADADSTIAFDDLADLQEALTRRRAG